LRTRVVQAIGEGHLAEVDVESFTPVQIFIFLIFF
jgi:hypothetical protein